MTDLFVIDRKSGKKIKETVYGGFAIRFLYETKGVGFLRSLISRLPIVSILFGFWQKQSFTKKNVQPFIQKFAVDSKEFEKQDFSSFNDFFVRKLKPDARPIAKSPSVIPADGRYRFFDTTQEPLFVKGAPFDLQSMLQDKHLADQFRGGSCIVARLCPTDCHRFYFPVSGIPSKTRLIKGPLFSVNPMALNKSFRYLTENKRFVTEIETDPFNKVLMLEVGATCVGSVHQTYTPGKRVEKGEEKGYFSFGGSALILLFQQGTLSFCQDLLEKKESPLEIYCQIGEPISN
jgi:phosphatidylserine decarboxylase